MGFVGLPLKHFIPIIFKSIPIKTFISPGASTNTLALHNRFSHMNLPLVVKLNKNLLVQYVQSSIKGEAVTATCLGYLSFRDLFWFKIWPWWNQWLSWQSWTGSDERTSFLRSGWKFTEVTLGEAVTRAWVWKLTVSCPPLCLSPSAFRRLLFSWQQLSCRQCWFILNVKSYKWPDSTWKLKNAAPAGGIEKLYKIIAQVGPH